MGDLVKFPEPAPPEEPWKLVYNSGWPTYTDMVKSLLDDLKTGKIMPPEGMVVFVYNNEATTVYRKGLTILEVAEICADYASGVLVDGPDEQPAA